MVREIVIGLGIKSITKSTNPYDDTSSSKIETSTHETNLCECIRRVIIVMEV